jgi:hypothetical protein
MTSSNGDPSVAGGRAQGAHAYADPMHNEDVAHEHSDINVATVLKAGAGLFATVVVCALIVWGVFGILERQAAARDPQLSPLARPEGQLPPGPHLETNERAALAKFRAEEAKAVGGYGWVNQLGGVAHIPVAEAKKLLVERGLPARSTAADPLEGTHAPAMGEASSGRSIPVRSAVNAPAQSAAEPTPADAGAGK